MSIKQQTSRFSSYVAFAKDFPRIYEQAIAGARPHQMKFLKRKGFDSWVTFAELPLEKRQELQKEWTTSPELKTLLNEIK